MNPDAQKVSPARGVRNIPAEHGRIRFGHVFRRHRAPRVYVVSSDCRRRRVSPHRVLVAKSIARSAVSNPPSDIRRNETLGVLYTGFVSDFRRQRKTTRSPADSVCVGGRGGGPCDFSAKRKSAAAAATRYGRLQTETKRKSTKSNREIRSALFRRALDGSAAKNLTVTRFRNASRTMLYANV